MGPAAKGKPKRAAGKTAGAAASGDSVTNPMQGTLVKVVVTTGQQATEDNTIFIVQAMKMEQSPQAARSPPDHRGRGHRQQ